MNKITYTLTYALLFIAGQVADAWTTYQLTRSTEYGVFRELNPLVNLNSFTTILMFPPTLFAMLVCTAIVAWCESNRGVIAGQLDGRLRNILLVPYYLLLLKWVAVGNNLVGWFGLGTPVSLFNRAFPHDYAWWGLVIMMTLVAAASTPVFRALLNRRYRLPTDSEYRKNIPHPGS